MSHKHKRAWVSRRQKRKAKRTQRHFDTVVVPRLVAHIATLPYIDVRRMALEWMRYG